MTPAARIAAAIAALEDILAGAPAERVLTRWARASRFAGSKDRAAVRDVVFDVLRRRRSLGWAAGAEDARALVIAHQIAEGVDPDTVFTGAQHAPPPLDPAERARLAAPKGAPPDPVALDYPDFLDQPLRASLGADFRPVMRALQDRAPVDLRVNTLKTTPAAAMVALARDGVQVVPHPLAPAALRVVGNPRAVAASRAYTQGMVELQDVASQAVAAFAGAAPGMRVVDYCAGGGGKALALAALMQGRGKLLAHDVNPARMKDLPARAWRAGAEITILPPETAPARPQRADLVLVDAPCSGTGAWRRTPDAKWRLGPVALDRLVALQAEILAAAARHVRPGGTLAYATCSLLAAENAEQVARFLEGRRDWRLEASRHFTPLDGGDGFYVARLRRATGD